MVWLLGRIYRIGTPADYAAVHALQDKFTLVPLSSYGKPYTPPGVRGRSECGYERRHSRSGGCHGHQGILQLPGSTDEDESTVGGRCAAVARMAKIGLVLEPSGYHASAVDRERVPESQSSRRTLLIYARANLAIGSPAGPGPTIHRKRSEPGFQSRPKCPR
jgi:hypothetical protein